MVCPCISPPPVFDIPPPPDPSLIWHLITDNDDDTVEELQQVQHCDAELLNTVNLIDWILSGALLDYLPYIIAAISIVISAILVLILLLFRLKRRGNKKKFVKNTNEHAGDIILNGDHNLRFDNVDGVSKKNVLIYGNSIHNNDFYSKAVPYSTTNCNRFMGTFDKSALERQPSTTLRLHSRPDGYYAASRMYEEIPTGRPDSASVFDDVKILQLNQADRDLRLRDSVRKPPPTCRPPPPPQGSPFSTGSSINSIEHELQEIHSSPSPKRSIDDDRKSRHSGENGRESGYGTAPSRLWNSPRLIPRFKEIKNRPGNETSPRQVPLAVYAHQNHAHSTMTYV
uniref:Pecanex-like protein n=1 Tax=Syphacia muris TaxID=451379 RepID=A0A0N5AJN3_9BILA